MNEKHVIFVCDGGGVRGLIPAIWIAYLESILKTPIQEKVHTFAGTSTGSILAAAFAKTKPISANEMVTLYQTKTQSIFKKPFSFNPFGLFKAKYEIENLKKALYTYFGDQRISECKSNLLICSYDIEKCYNLYFTNTLAKTNSDYNVKLIDAAAGSSAAMTFFIPNRFVNGNTTFTCVDGAICSLNNPSAIAVCNLINKGVDPADIFLVSFGTGTQQSPYLYKDIEKAGVASLVKPIIEIQMDGASEAYDFITKSILKSENYVRLQVDLTEETKAMDDTSVKNLIRLRDLSENAIVSQQAKFDKILKILA